MTALYFLQLIDLLWINLKSKHTSDCRRSLTVPGSKAVSYLSTDHARRCLTSVIEWETNVFNVWDGDDVCCFYVNSDWCILLILFLVRQILLPFFKYLMSAQKTTLHSSKLAVYWMELKYRIAFIIILNKCYRFFPIYSL